MSYEVVYDPDAERQLDKLPKEVSRRIIKKMREVPEKEIGIEPLKEHHYGYKVRVGDYRVLIDLEYNAKRIMVRFIDKRSRVYKRS